VLLFVVFGQFLWSRAHSMIRPAALLAAVLAISSPLIGQQDSTRQLSQPSSTGRSTPDALENRAKPPAQELVKLTTRSDLVVVPVLVTDKSGKHVPGLQKEAFRIEEDGKVRSVSITTAILALSVTVSAPRARTRG
jgi:hypothetical protein